MCRSDMGHIYAFCSRDRRAITRPEKGLRGVNNPSNLFYVARLDVEVGRWEAACLKGSSNRPTSSNRFPHAHTRERVRARVYVGFYPPYFSRQVLLYLLDEVRRLDGLSIGAGCSRPTSPSIRVCGGWTE